MNAGQIIRAAIPNASDETCEYVLWERTGYPFKRLTARDLYKAASRMKRAEDNGIVLCDFCDNKANENYICDSCREVLDAARRNRAEVKVWVNQ